MKNLASLTSLRVFSVVGKRLSFTDAAKELGVTQSAVSRQIKSLENSLNIDLFNRVGNSVSLTKDGESLHRRIFEIFGLMEDAISDITNSVQQRKLNILAPPTLAARWLPSNRTGILPWMCSIQRWPDLQRSQA